MCFSSRTTFGADKSLNAGKVWRFWHLMIVTLWLSYKCRYILSFLPCNNDYDDDVLLDMSFSGESCERQDYEQICVANSKFVFKILLYSAQYNWPKKLYRHLGFEESSSDFTAMSTMWRHYLFRWAIFPIWLSVLSIQ